MLKHKAFVQPFTDEPITVLNEAGEWIAPFELDLEPAFLQKLYKDMLKARQLDQRFMNMQRMGKMSFVAPHSGHEAAQIAAAQALIVKKDWLFPYYRDYPMAMSLGLSIKDILAQVTGSSLDNAKARQMPMHPSSKELNIFTGVSAIAAHIPPAVGAAISMKIQGTEQVALTSFGDGATSEGDFHAAINYAGAQGAPVVFLCENNRLAISVDFTKQTGAENIMQKAHAYGMPGYQVDGMDVIACYYVMKEAIENARAGLGPSLVEALVYRYGPHSSADDDSVYRSKEELETWKRRDPLIRMRRFLETMGLWSIEQEETYLGELVTLFQAAVDELAKADAVPKAWMFEDVFKDMPQHLQEQKRELLD